MHCITVRGGSGSFASCDIAHAPAGEPLVVGSNGVCWASREPGIALPAPGLVLGAQFQHG
jgi:hypothetical protein